MKGACLKQMGNCLCPQCFVEKRQVPQVGSPEDMERRLRERVDNEERQADIEEARELIFLEGATPASSGVEAILNPTSSLPVHVSSLSPVN